jgi:hypothetical protein
MTEREPVFVKTKCLHDYVAVESLQIIETSDKEENNRIHLPLCLTD